MNTADWLFSSFVYWAVTMCFVLIALVSADQGQYLLTGITFPVAMAMFYMAHRHFNDPATAHRERLRRVVKIRR